MCSIANPLGCVSEAVAGGAKHVANSVFSEIAKGFASAAEKTLDWLWTQLGTATSINLSDVRVRQDISWTLGIATVMALGMFLIQVITSVLRQDAGGLGRAVRGLVVAFVGSAFAIAVTGLALAAVDEISNELLKVALGTNAEGLGKKLVTYDALNGLQPAPMFLLAIILLVATVVVWAALMIRKMLIIVSAVFAPIAFAGATADITRGWVRKWIELTAAMAFSKLILVVIWMVGLSVLNGAGGTGGTTNGLTSMAIGCLLLLLGGFAPWIAIKMVHFTGDQFHHLHAQAAGARAGGTAVTSAPQKANALHSQFSAAKTKFASGSGTDGGAQPAQLRQPVGSATPTNSPSRAVAGMNGSLTAAPPVAIAAGVAQAGRHAADKAGDAVEHARGGARTTQREPWEPPYPPLPGGPGSAAKQ